MAPAHHPANIWAKTRARLIAAAATLFLHASSLHAAPPAVIPTDPAAWAEIARAAKTIQAADGTETALPFARPAPAALAALPRKVFIHYFPAFPTSIDNAPAESDTWARELLARTGQRGRLATAGGFARERPLPSGPQASPHWREINVTVDVLRAQALGADAFGVNLMETAGPTFDAATRLCLAAQRAAPGFHIFGEPDAAATIKDSAETVARIITLFQACPSALRRDNGHGLIMPFAPENRSPAFWADVLRQLHAAGHDVDMIPAHLNLLAAASQFAGLSQGVSAWGQRDIAYAARPEIRAKLAQVRSAAPAWIQAISPQGFAPKALHFLESRNTEAFRTSWMEAITTGAQAVHLITWNDYGEATEIAPSTGIQFVFYDLSAYYAAWFKTGAPPRILRDALYYTHRNQVFQPDHPPKPGDAPFRRLGETQLSNDIEMIALLPSPAEIEIEIAGVRTHQTAPAGLTVLRATARPGRPVFRILRNGRPTVEKVSDWEIQAQPEAASGLYFGGSSTRRFIPPPTAKP